MRYLTFTEVTAINQYAIEQFSPGEPVGIISPELLSSAVNRPRQSAFRVDAYETVFEKVCALFQSIAQNHAFHNTNKRTAFLSLVQFLAYNGFSFHMETQNSKLILRWALSIKHIHLQKL